MTRQPAMSAPAPAAPGHVPVLLAEVIEALQPRAAAVMVDGTFGAGGYTRALLQAGANRVIAIDRDPDAIVAGRIQEAASNGQLTLLEGCFADMEALLASQSVLAVDGVTFDVGVSSMQIDQPHRGFSFMQDGPLDMRMSQSGESAADVVASRSQAELADIIYRYGEEKRSRRIAAAIVAARTLTPITTTSALAGIVRGALGGRSGPKDPATRTFQALRIFVNRELEQLHQGLLAAERCLAPGGRLAIVSFHSLEDRIVKQFLQARSKLPSRGSRHVPDTVSTETADPSATFTFSHVAKPVRPGRAECAANPRARSAILRSAIRTAQPVSPALV